MMDLPASNAGVLAECIDPASEELPDKMNSDDADRCVLAIGRQESGFRTRDQEDASGKLGPALGLWQFQENGVKGVCDHPHSGSYLQAYCGKIGLAFNPHDIWLALAQNDVLAALVARLLIWTDPEPLPRTEMSVWVMYSQRLWRPGAPDYHRWHTDSWPQAVASVPL